MPPTDESEVYRVQTDPLEILTDPLGQSRPFTLSSGTSRPRTQIESYSVSKFTNALRLCLNFSKKYFGRLTLTAFAPRDLITYVHKFVRRTKRTYYGRIRTARGETRTLRAGHFGGNKLEIRPACGVASGTNHVSEFVDGR
jgi:hypothetical protein